MKKSNKKKILTRIIFVVAMCVFVFSAFQLGKIYFANYQEKEETKKLRDIVKAPKSEKKLDEFTVNFTELKKINPEIIGWIIVKDTSISYPIVQHDDNKYYLNHTSEKKENYAGAIFMDYRNKADFSDYNTFIYGHNVYHGTMFAELEKYMDEDFFKNHPFVYLYTPNQNYKLQVYSAYTADAEGQSYKLSYSDLYDYSNYETYVKGLSRYDSGVTMTAADKMVTLYTCSYENGDNPDNTQSDEIRERYYIHCKMIKALNGEMPYNSES